MEQIFDLECRSYSSVWPKMFTQSRPHCMINMSLHQIDEISCVLSQNIPSFNIFYRLTDIGIRKANASGTVHPFIMSSCGGLKWPQLTKRIKRHQFSQHPSHLQTTNAAKNTSLRICLTFVMHFPQQKNRLFRKLSTFIRGTLAFHFKPIDSY